MRNKDRRSEFNRGNILDAAKRLFADKGVAQTTVDDVAREADYSKSTLYAYFKSKDEIYDYIILEHFELLKQAIAGALYDNPGFPAGYFAVCDALVRFRDAYPLYFESILSDVKIPEDESETVLTQIYRVGEEINAIIEGYLRAHIQQTRLGMSAFQATMTLWASLGGIITLAAQKEAYLQKAAGVTRETFMRDAFEMLLKSMT